MQFVGGQLGPPEDETDLRAVAMRYGHIPAFGDHLGDMLGRVPGRFVLVGHRLVLLVFNQRVSADGNDGNLLVL